ncbi:unnamed protein product [Tetraodon nigroviridis]|uniref:Chromosome 12 SCAF14652, whole genome shotgun sequence n=1 Tax=Tetraodon nigroviridis TaxID=99883 RepID=Q4SCM4_TETNG|nr:unnamed protein product [Tetraodon nigroviridis]
MSSQKGNVSRSRGQKHQNTVAFKNDKYGSTTQLKNAKAKIHDGLCQHCKDVLEWKVKYNKYKALTQPRKCVKCSQKTVKDAYHIICKPCSLRLEICCKCGKKEEIIIPVNSQGLTQDTDETPKQHGYEKKDMTGSDSDDEDLSDFGDEQNEEEEIKDCQTETTTKKSDVLPNVSAVSIKD